MSTFTDYSGLGPNETLTETCLRRMNIQSFFMFFFIFIIVQNIHLQLQLCTCFKHHNFHQNHQLLEGSYNKETKVDGKSTGLSRQIDKPATYFASQ